MRRVALIFWCSNLVQNTCMLIILRWFLQFLDLMKGSFGELFPFCCLLKLVIKMISRLLKLKTLKKNNCFSFTGHDIIYCYNAEILISDNKIQTFYFISRPCWKLQKCISIQRWARESRMVFRRLQMQMTSKLLPK